MEYIPEHIQELVIVSPLADRFGILGVGIVFVGNIL
jgi:hypothetical protein